MARAYIGFGSNIAPETHIEEALRLLARRVRIVGISTVYRTKPIARPEQPDYFNGVCAVETELFPRTLKFEILREIEDDLGRQRTEDTYAARSIDLDLLLYGDWQIDEPDMQVPDPDIRTRPFLAAALVELSMGLRMPGSEEPVAQLFKPEQLVGLHPLEQYTQQLRERFLKR